MKIALVYNRESKNVINLFGVPNREKYGKRTIKKITDALKKGGHQVKTLEADKMLIPNLEKFMPRAIKGESPGMVFNVSYGIQGQARYTHVPSILEMIGIPYTGSGPVAHSLALDKVVAKMVFIQHGLPTPDFAVLESSSFEVPALSFPMIVKPKNEAVSFGLRIVNDEKELREAAEFIFKEYQEAVLVEEYIEGREINVGLLGNDPIKALPPVELIFEEGAPRIYTYEDKVHRSGRNIGLQCPADIGEEARTRAVNLAVKAFKALECRDFARIDMRMNAEGEFYILEINSLASLGEGSSYVRAAQEIGMDYPALINRIVEIARSRYSGVPDDGGRIYSDKIQDSDIGFEYITRRRDQIEKRLNQWCDISGRTDDPVGISAAAGELGATMRELKMLPVEQYTDDRFVWTWATKCGFEGGTLLIAHLDVPRRSSAPFQRFHRDPEHLYGEGIGAGRASLVAVEYALRVLRRMKKLDRKRVGFFVYADEGLSARYSEKTIRTVSSKAGRVLVLRPGNSGDKVITQRRGRARYRLSIQGAPLKLGQTPVSKSSEPLVWWSAKLLELSSLTNKPKRIAVSAGDIRVEGFPMRLPHRVTVELNIGYYDEADHNDTLAKIKNILGEKNAGIHWRLDEMSNRPPMKERKINKDLLNAVRKAGEEMEIPVNMTSSLWPSVAGLVPKLVPVVCGMGPVAENLYTPYESVQRISLIQRILLLTRFLIEVS